MTDRERGVSPDIHSQVILGKKVPAARLELEEVTADTQHTSTHQFAGEPQQIQRGLPPLLLETLGRAGEADARIQHAVIVTFVPHQLHEEAQRRVEAQRPPDVSPTVSMQNFAAEKKSNRQQGNPAGKQEQPKVERIGTAEEKQQSHIQAKAHYFPERSKMLRVIGRMEELITKFGVSKAVADNLAHYEAGISPVYSKDQAILADFIQKHPDTWQAIQEARRAAQEHQEDKRIPVSQTYYTFLAKLKNFNPDEYRIIDE